MPAYYHILIVFSQMHIHIMSKVRASVYLKFKKWALDKYFCFPNSLLRKYLQTIQLIMRFNLCKREA